MREKDVDRYLNVLENEVLKGEGLKQGFEDFDMNLDRREDELMKKIEEFGHEVKEIIEIEKVDFVEKVADHKEDERIEKELSDEKERRKKDENRRKREENKKRRKERKERKDRKKREEDEHKGEEVIEVKEEIVEEVIEVVEELVEDKTPKKSGRKDRRARRGSSYKRSGSRRSGSRRSGSGGKDKKD